MADLTAVNHVLVRAACSADWSQLQNLYFNCREFEAVTTAIVRKVSNLRVWGLGRLTGFCNPDNNTSDSDLDTFLMLLGPLLHT